MGLPVLQRRRGQSNHEFYNYCLYKAKILKSTDYDGYVNENSRDILLKLKDYFEVAQAHIIALMSLIESFNRIDYVWDVDPYFADHEHLYIFRRVRRNIGRMLKSLKEQRIVAFAYKDTIKKNALTQQWVDVFNSFIDDCNKRLDTIMVLVNENLECTPYIFYTAYLKKNGISITDDMKEALGKEEYFNLIYDRNFDTINDRAVNHICDIFSISSKDQELISECVSNAKQYDDAVKRRKEQRKKEQEDEFEEILKSRKEEAVAILNSVSSRFDATYKASLKNARSRNIQHYNAGYKPFYIIASIDTGMFTRKSEHYRYRPDVLYASCNTRGHTRVSDIQHAKKFSSIEEAEEYANECKALKPHLETVICKVDLAWNTASKAV